MDDLIDFDKAALFASSTLYETSTMECKLEWWKQIACQMAKGTWINGTKQNYFQDMANVDLVWRQDFLQHVNFYELEKDGENELRKIGTLHKNQQGISERNEQPAAENQNENADMEFENGEQQILPVV